MTRTLLCILLPLILARPALAAGPANLSAEARRGEKLVALGGCNDCHTPFKMGPDGLVPDMSRMLSGHTERIEIPTSSRLPTVWLWIGAESRTAFTGPWGVSYATNLTPDRETGLGDWTEREFVAAMRTGKHRGSGRSILPPMSWGTPTRRTDAEVRAIWAYLRRIPPIRNEVPSPRSAEPPPGVAQGK